MSNFKELANTDCPLLDGKSAEVVALFNEAVNLFHEIQREFPEFMVHDSTCKNISDFEEIRSRLVRQRYSVGFLGTTQAGKSTTFNKILDDAVAESGGGGATTSAVTRLLPMTAGKPSLLLRYLTVKEYHEKRKTLCDLLRLTVASPDDEFTPLFEKFHQTKVWEHGDGAPIIHDDVIALERLLVTYKQFKNLVGETRVEKSAKYDERGKILNHDSQDAVVRASPNFLLREAIVEFPTRKIPDKVEIIDLPGLGANSAVDTMLTMGFLGELDGAFIFIRGENIDNTEIEKIFAKLKQFWPGKKLGKRVWIVITKLDALDRPHWYGDPSKTVVAHILRVLEKHQIPPTQVCLTSAKLYDKRGVDGRLDKEVVKASLKQGTADDPFPPPTLKANSHLSAAFDLCCEDGGIRALRELIVRDLCAAVAEETRVKAQGDLAALIARLKDDITTEQRRREWEKEDPEKLLNAFTCWGRVSKLVAEWETRVDFLEPIGQELKKKLLDQFSKFMPANEQILKAMTPPQLGQWLENASKSLKATLDNLMNTAVIEKVYGKVGSEMADLPAVPIWSDAGPLQAWERFGREDRNGTWREGSFPSLSCSQLFSETRGSPLDNAAYCTLLHEKVRTGSQQVMHVLKSRVRGRLHELRTQLSKLVYVGNGSHAGE